MLFIPLLPVLQRKGRHRKTFIYLLKKLNNYLSVYGIGPIIHSIKNVHYIFHVNFVLKNLPIFRPYDLYSYWSQFV